MHDQTFTNAPELTVNEYQATYGGFRNALWWTATSLKVHLYIRTVKSVRILSNPYINKRKEKKN